MQYEERVSAFSTEEVLFIIGPSARCQITKSNEVLTDDGSFAVEVARCKVLHNINLSVSYSTHSCWLMHFTIEGHRLRKSRCEHPGSNK